MLPEGGKTETYWNKKTVLSHKGQGCDVEGMRPYVCLPLGFVPWS